MEVYKGKMKFSLKTFEKMPAEQIFLGLLILIILALMLVKVREGFKEGNASKRAHRKK